MSTKDMTRRIDVLEERLAPAPPRRNVILTIDADCSPEDEARGVAEAEEAAGPNGRVIMVTYEQRPPPPWWTPAIVQEQAALRAARPAHPPYTIDLNDGWHT